MLQFSLRSLFRCVELTSDAVVSEYQEARWRARSRANDQRLGIVRQVLTGHHANAEDLRYDLDSFHLGLVAWGPDADQAVRALAGDLDLSYLSVCSDGEETWGWLGSTEALSRQADRRLARFRPPGQAALAVGLPSLGLDGFRRSHSQAQLARRIALWCPAPLTLYRDVALEAVVSEERPVVQDFIRQELGELAEFGGRAEVLRATLDAYFACAQNATAAAARLEIHNQTVRYRLRTIEETIGHALASRSAELQLALRLHPLYVEADRAVSDDRRDVGEQVGPGRP
jgi:hypothetical protein